MSDTPWILATQEPLGFLCERCGARLTIGSSVPMAVFVAAGNGFRSEHATCEPAPAAHEVRRAGGLELPGFGSEG